MLIIGAMGLALNMSDLAAGRAALQRAVDNAALSGAAAYSLGTASFQQLAVTTATSAFCNATAAFPENGTVVVQSGGQSCGAGLGGPVVSATTNAYVTGVPGASNGGPSCTGAYLPPAPTHCGFIVTVSAKATVTSMISAVFGGTTTMSVTGMAANPFISFAKVFSLPGGVVSGAKYANSVWAYALQLNANGGLDYSQNPGALPDTSSCNQGPDQVVCGAYVMLASTMYSKAGTGYTPPGQSVIYDNGVVRNPASPTQITATTPIGLAFESIAGGNYVQYSSSPGVYGYDVVQPKSNPQYVYAPSGCIYPYSKLVYNTVGQVWTTNTKGGPLPYMPMAPWSLVAHWYYSSYLTQNLPPSYGEIQAQQIANNEDIPSVTNNAYNTGNIAGSSTYNANPSPSVATTCPSTTKVNNVTQSNDLLQSTSFITGGNDNCSVYVVKSAAPIDVSTPPLTGSCLDPSNTQGQAYAALSCQSYGSYYYTFFWNDMGGAQTDNLNYADGTVQISCSSAARVVLIG